MMRLLLLAAICAALLLNGCGEDPAPPASEEAADAEALSAAPAAGPEEDAMLMEDIDLYLFNTGLTHGQERQPAVWVHANEFTRGEEDTYTFSGARAVFYGDDSEVEEVTVEAEEGRFEEGRAAHLRGNVRAQAADMSIELSDITWQNPENPEESGIAQTDQPVRIESDNLSIEAGSLRLDPVAKTFTVTEIRGSIRFGSAP